jgi:hypothetical protein
LEGKENADGEFEIVYLLLSEFDELLSILGGVGVDLIAILIALVVNLIEVSLA